MTIPEVIGGTSLNNPPTQPEQLNGSAEGVELPGNNAAVRDSVLGRLLQELSWVGAQIRDFHDGGLGFENVLTAEALTALDFLPRTDFLGAVLEAAHGAAAARTKAVAEIEQAEVTLFPEQLVLRPNAPTNQKLVVQPDGSVISTGSYVMIEAKRIRASTFQPEQLAREYVALMREAQGRTPLLVAHPGLGTAGRRQGAWAPGNRRGDLAPSQLGLGTHRRSRPRRSVSRGECARGGLVDHVAGARQGRDETAGDLLLGQPFGQRDRIPTGRLAQELSRPSFVISVLS